MTLQELINDMGHETRSYSGRGMYGKTCLAVKPEGISDLQFMLELGRTIAENNMDADDHQIVKYPKSVASDSLGLSSASSSASERV
jgi:hypothetical protein